jgi:hypothetical protein
MTHARITVTGSAGPYDLRLSLADDHNQNMVFNDEPYFAVDVIDLPNRRSHQAIISYDANLLTDEQIVSAMQLLYTAATGGQFESAEYRGNARLWVTESEFGKLTEVIGVLARELRTVNYEPASRERVASVLSGHALKLSAWARAYMVKGF